MTHPYENEALNKIYDLLFCDNIDLYRPETKPGDNIYPYNILFADNPGNDQLEKILHDVSLESRLKLLACRLLVANGIRPQKELLGIIIEVGLDNGLDVLAAFKDGTARYINHAENIIVWETTTKQSGDIINSLFIVSENVVKQIGPWDKERKQPPGNGMVRLNFLVSDGLYFGEGLFDVLAKDPMGGPVIYAGIDLMKFLIEQAEKKKS